MKNLGIILAASVVLVAGSALVHAQEVAVQDQAVKAVNAGNKICPVSGEKVASDTGMAPVTYEYNGKVYNLCCGGCIATFKADPEKYSKIAEEEVAKEAAAQ